MESSGGPLGDSLLLVGLLEAARGARGHSGGMLEPSRGGGLNALVRAPPLGPSWADVGLGGWRGGPGRLSDLEVDGATIDQQSMTDLNVFGSSVQLPRCSRSGDLAPYDRRSRVARSAVRWGPYIFKELHGGTPKVHTGYSCHCDLHGHVGETCRTSLHFGARQKEVLLPSDHGVAKSDEGAVSTSRRRRRGRRRLRR